MLNPGLKPGRVAFALVAVVTLVLLTVMLPSVFQAEKVEVAPGIAVSRKTYPVPSNEAPFFNFAVKTENERVNDAHFVAGVLQLVPDRAKAAREASERGWQFVKNDDFATAAKRFNQAFLLDPKDSALYHGFAAVVASRFRDFAYADELYEIAGRMNAPSKILEADRARVLLMAGRPADAKPLLERAVRDNPESAIPKSNLAWATYQLGEAAEACRIIATITGIDMDAVEEDVAMLKRRAACP